MNDIQTQFLKEVEIVFYFHELGEVEWVTALRKLKLDLPSRPEVGKLTGFDLDVPRIKLRTLLRSPR